MPKEMKLENVGEYELINSTWIQSMKSMNVLDKTQIDFFLKLHVDAWEYSRLKFSEHGKMDIYKQTQNQSFCW